MEYQRTQRAPLWLILLLPAVVLLAAAWFARAQPVLVILFLALAATCLLVAMMFRTLTICDEGDALAIRYGPLPLLGTRIRYADVTAVEPGRTSVIDGWGVHWVPGRGTTYNLWGFDCVRIRLGRRLVNVGSDDVENLVAFLRSRTGLTA